VNISATLFAGPQFSCFDGDITDTEAATAPVFGPISDRYDVLSVQQALLPMALNDTYTIAPALFAAAEITYFIFRVVGTVEVDTTGKDYSGAAISGKMQIYGTSLFPGFGVFCGITMTACSLKAITAATVQVMAMITTTPTDARLIAP
jgi:hypothetical protein